MSKTWIRPSEIADRSEGEITVGYMGLPVGLEPDQLEFNAGLLRRGVIGWGGYSALTLACYRGEEDSYAYGVGTDGGGARLWYGLGECCASRNVSTAASFG